MEFEISGYKISVLQKLLLSLFFGLMNHSPRFSDAKCIDFMQ